MKLLYEVIGKRNYGTQFNEKVVLISKRLGINPSWLMAVMWNESRLNHKAVNPKSKASGLIQFMPSTAKGLGTTTAALLEMSALDQLDYVQKYFWPYRGKIRKAEDLYFITFYPYALGKPDEFVLGSQVSEERAELIAKQNPYFNPDKDEKITVGEFRAMLRKHTFKDLPLDELGK